MTGFLRESVGHQKVLAFGWGNESQDGHWTGKVCRGQQGIDGFIAFLRFCVQNQGLKGGLIEPKVENRDAPETDGL